MSKTTDKRAYARTQPKAPVLRATEWESAKAAYVAANDAHDTAWLAAGDDKSATLPLLHAYKEARDRLLGTPAPDGQALAFKLAVLSVMLAGDNIYTAEERASVAAGDDDEAKALLACYFDAMALGGVRKAAPIAQPFDREAARVDHLIARHASAYEAEGFGNTPEGEAQAKEAWASAERELIGAPATRPLHIAYKLRAAWLGRNPTFPLLDQRTAPAILRDPEQGSDDKLVASAFVDLLVLDAKLRGGDQ